jgi:hypothetical protein|nr:MAG TPA: Nuclease [Caudoviricetes sp.]
MAEEKNFENKVKKWLKAKGIYYFKYFGNAYSTAGILDLTLCVNGKFVGVELKAEKGKTSSLQDYNIKKIQESGGIAIVLRPSGFEDFKKIIEDLLNDQTI